ncbi:MAG TPA: PEP-CTERM sorting domain-containing protein [Acidobacteriaceae bacterium]
MTFSRKILSLCSVGILGLASTAVAHADAIGASETFTFTQGGSLAATPGNYGTVKITQTATGVVTVLVTLAEPGEYFAGTGAGNALDFNLIGDPSITIGNLTSGFQAGPAPAAGNPFGSFDYSVSCNFSGGGCNTGAGVGNTAGPLSFTVTDALGVNLSDFFALNGTNFFSTDIFIGNTSTGVGNTGVVATLGGTPNVPTPEPSSLMLLGTGIIGAAGMLRKRMIPAANNG